MKRLILFATLFLAAPTAVLADAAAGLEHFKRGEYGKALEELRPSAKEGDPNAAFVLGKMYGAGLGVKKDTKRALEYLRQAANSGQAEAMNELAVAIMLGHDGKRDMVEALKWLIIASDSGVAQAKTMSNQISKYMTFEMVLEARRSARKWKKNFNKRAEATN